jgi:hypothetical protein
LTVGKSIANGVVLYRDIYEQKGPWLYFIHIIAYLISNSTFIGVYFIEVASGTLFLIFAYKIYEMYCPKLAISFIPLTAFLIYIGKSFSHGDSVEELCLPIFAFTLYILLKFIKYRSFNRPFLTSLVIGFLCGVVFLMKFTLMGFYLVFCLFFLVTLIIEKKWRLLCRIIPGYFAGVILSFIPVIIYFGINHAFSDFIKVYFYNNFFLYSTNSGILHSMIYILVATASTLAHNFQYSILIIIGFIMLLFSKSKEIKRSEKIVLYFLAVITTIFIYIGGRKYVYYGLILAVFLLPALGVIGQFLENKLFKNIKKITVVYAAAALLVFCTLASFFVSPNVYLMKIKKSDLPQYEFSSIILSKKDPTLLTYGTMDDGFYLAANIVPNCKYFGALSIPLPEISEGQKSYVENHKVDFIVAAQNMDQQFILSNNYHLVDTASLNYEGSAFTYCLYELNSIK